MALPHIQKQMHRLSMLAANSSDGTLNIAIEFSRAADIDIEDIKAALWEPFYIANIKICISIEGDPYLLLFGPAQGFASLCHMEQAQPLFEHAEDIRLNGADDSNLPSDNAERIDSRPIRAIR